jgi:xanthine phosphoribosyltransferase
VNKQVIKFNDYTNLVSKICRDITFSGWKPDIIVGITRGGLLPAVMISHWLDVKMNSLDISLRDGGDTVSNCGLAEDAYDGKNILVVDDINDTGATFNWLMEDWRNSALPSAIRWDNDVWNKTVRFAVVVDNLASKCNVKMDFAGMEVNKAENDVWIEFPYEEWWTK